MGLFSKLLGLRVKCPSCGTSGAKDGFLQIKCRNPQCRDFDEGYAHAGWYEAPPHGEPGRSSVEFSEVLDIVYENARGERKTFHCERSSLQPQGDRVSVRVAPSGGRIRLALARIANRADVQPALAEAHTGAAAAIPDFTHPVEVAYENYLGEQKTFLAARNTIRLRPASVSLCVAPEGRRISLKRERIRNWEHVEREMTDS